MSAENKYLKFDRTQILNRYWELANLTPEQTKGSIAGQLKALDSLIKALGLTRGAEKPKPAEKQPQEVEIYRSKWMN